MTIEIVEDLKLFVIKVLIDISTNCPDYKLRLQALELLNKIADSKGTR